MRVPKELVEDFNDTLGPVHAAIDDMQTRAYKRGKQDGMAEQSLVVQLRKGNLRLIGQREELAEELKVERHNHKEAIATRVARIEELVRQCEKKDRQIVEIKRERDMQGGEIKQVRELLATTAAVMSRGRVGFLTEATHAEWMDTPEAAQAEGGKP